MSRIAVSSDESLMKQNTRPTLDLHFLLQIVSTEWLTPKGQTETQQS